MPTQQPVVERMGVALRELTKPAKLTIELRQVPRGSV
jgi:hypothetical protein